MKHTKLPHLGISKAESGLTAAIKDPEKRSEHSHLSFRCCFGTSSFNRVQEPNKISLSAKVKLRVWLKLTAHASRYINLTKHKSLSWTRILKQSKWIFHFYIYIYKREEKSSYFVTGGRRWALRPPFTMATKNLLAFTKRPPTEHTACWKCQERAACENKDYAPYFLWNTSIWHA